MGQVESTFFQTNRAELQRTNYALLRRATLFAAGMCFFLFCLTLLNPLIGELTGFYAIYTLVFALLAVLTLLVVSRRKWLVGPVFYAFATAIFVLVIDVGTRRTPSLPAVTFYVFLIIIPILYVTRPVYSVALSVAACLGFCITAVQVKGAGSYLAQTDVLNAVCCTIVGIGMDVTIVNLQLENIRSRRYFQNQSTTDELTGLPNRRAFDRYVSRPFRLQRERRRDFAVVMVDIDDFKAYNDTYGHIEGDECLRRVSAALERVARVHDVFLARFGGEEFVLAGVPRSEGDLRKGCERLVSCVAEQRIEHRETARGYVTISVGYATLKDTQAPNYRALIDPGRRGPLRGKGRGEEPGQGMGAGGRQCLG